MTAERDLDRQLDAWFRGRATASVPEGLLARSLARVGTTRQRPGWLVRDRGSSARSTGRRASAPGLSRLLLAIFATVVLVAAGVFIYLRLSPAMIGGPTNAPSGPGTPGWSPTGSMVAPRHHHTATLLPDGMVLVAGGSNGIDVLASAELYDPRTGSWSATGSVSTPRSGHTATLLLDGKVLVVGGSDGTDEQASAELYDPRTGSWSATGSMITGREQHTATLLPDGEVLVAGGIDQAGSPVASAELYDPVSGAWTATMSMGTPRYGHAATILQDGKVLVMGGADHGGGGCCSLTSAELYTWGSRSWTTTGSMSTEHGNDGATLLQDGRVLLVGAVEELYDPRTGSWSTVGGKVASCCEATLLADGKVLVLGIDTPSLDVTAASLYDPGAGSWTPAGRLGTQRLAYTATLLPDGRVLVAGGWSAPAPIDTAPSGLASAELYQPGIAR
jgi:hypothetical protein